MHNASATQTPPLVCVETSFVVSSDAWLARTTIVRSGLATVLYGGDGQLWLVSGQSVLAPDQDEVRQQAHEAGGPKAAESRIAQTKVEVLLPGPAGLHLVMRNARPHHLAALHLGAIQLAGSAEEEDTLSGCAVACDPLAQIEVTTPLWQSGMHHDPAGVAHATQHLSSFASNPQGGFLNEPGLVAIDCMATRSLPGALITVANSGMALGVVADCSGDQILAALVPAISQSLMLLGNQSHARSA